MLDRCGFKNQIDRKNHTFLSKCVVEFWFKVRLLFFRVFHTPVVSNFSHDMHNIL